MKRRRNRCLVVVLLLLLCLLPGCAQISLEKSTVKTSVTKSGAASGSTTVISLSDIPEYSGDAYVTINDNEPDFTEDELTTESYESYSDLDELGRCQTAEASIGEDLMPTEKRGSIGQVKPSGWKTVKYDCVDGKYLYNRCHLIGYQLTAENANEKNLITGTRYLNVDGMLPFENMVADYIKETGNHVMYRVTPIFEGDNLVASGVQMEALSVEDEGEGISYNVFVYNVQPGIEIDYATGDSKESGDTSANTTANTTKNTTTSTTASTSANVQSGSKESKTTYILNTGTMKFHLPSCASVSDISSKNKETYKGTRTELIEKGYDACGRCKP